MVHLAATENSAGPAQVGFVVSRAVGSAVTRNLVKRRLREAMRTRLDRLSAGSLLVVRANPAAATAVWPRLCQDLDIALSRVLAGSQTGGRTVATGSGRGRGAGTGAPTGIAGPVAEIGRIPASWAESARSDPNREGGG